MIPAPPDPLRDIYVALVFGFGVLALISFIEYLSSKKGQ